MHIVDYNKHDFKKSNDDEVRKPVVSHVAPYLHVTLVTQHITVDAVLKVHFDTLVLLKGTHLCVSFSYAYLLV